jgi:hypothetical protein
MCVQGFQVDDMTAQTVEAPPLLCVNGGQASQLATPSVALITRLYPAWQYPCVPSAPSRAIITGFLPMPSLGFQLSELYLAVAMVARNNSARAAIMDVTTPPGQWNSSKSPKKRTPLP